MKLNYKKPVVKSLTDPKAGFPAALVAAASVVSAATNLTKALGDKLDFIKGSTLVDSKEDSKNISVQ